ncbi:unnamed protein product [Rhodiola kirilowii]
MAAETPFIDFDEQLQDDPDDGSYHIRHRQREVVDRGRDFAILPTVWFDEFEDSDYSDSEHSVDLRPVNPFFTVDYSNSDGEDFVEESNLVQDGAVDGISDAELFGESDVFRRDNHVDYVRCYFPDRVDSVRRRSDCLSASDFGVSDDDDSNDVDLRLGLDFGEEDNSNFMVDDEIEDDFCLGVRMFGNSLGSEDDESEEAGGSDLCSEEEYEFDTIEDQREADEELEWEDVNDSYRNEELVREFNRLLGDVDDETVESVLQLRNDEVVLARVVFEVLLNAAENIEVGNVELGNEDVYFGVEEGHFDADEYETMFGQFTDPESGVMGKPPAAKSVVENLAVVVMTQADVKSKNSLCAVCKDDMGVGEKAKRLPCSHSYHGDCIIPWLGIRNTCPVCRFELPTDDSVYERRRT